MEIKYGYLYIDKFNLYVTFLLISLLRFRIILYAKTKSIKLIDGSY